MTAISTSSIDCFLNGLGAPSNPARNLFLYALIDEAWLLRTYRHLTRDSDGSLDAWQLYLLNEAGKAPGSPLFDGNWYADKYLKGASWTAALLDYLNGGAELGRRPTPLFDERWYCARYPWIADAVAAGGYWNAYHHFLAEGAAAGLDPSPLFFENWYRDRYPDVAAAIESGLCRSGYHDYCRRPWAQERDPNPFFSVTLYRDLYPRDADRALRSWDSCLRRGGYAAVVFHETWYLEKNAAVRSALASGQYSSAIEHFLYEGYSQGLSATPYFIESWYRSWYPDVDRRVTAGEFNSGFEHYLLHGARRGYSPNPFFDELWYLRQHPDIRNAVDRYDRISGHEHFVLSGALEGRMGSTLLDPGWYLHRYSDVDGAIHSGACRNAYEHYCRFGRFASKSCSPHFDESWYLAEYPDAADGVRNGRWVTGLHHYLVHGLLEGRAPLPGPAAEPADATAAWPALLELDDFLSSDRPLLLPHAGEPLVSVILILYNRAELTLRCLRSLARWADVPCEIIAIDNASSDATQALLERVQGARIYRNAVNTGFTLAANQGARAAKGKHLLFLNNDAEIQIQAIGSAAALLDRDPGIGIVGGKIIHHTGVLQEAGSYLTSDFSLQIGRGQPPFASEYMHRRDVPYCSGALLMTPRELFLRIGLFNEDFAPFYCEDAEYCLRVWRNGLRVTFSPDSMVVHQESASTRNKRFLWPVVMRNYAMFTDAYREYFENIQPPPAVPVSWSDGLHTREPWLMVIESVDGLAEPDPTEGFESSLRMLLEQGRSVTIFPLSPWNGDRRPFRNQVPPEVEISTMTFDSFCQARRSQYAGIVVFAAIKPEQRGPLRGCGKGHGSFASAAALRHLLNS